MCRDATLGLELPAGRDFKVRAPLAILLARLRHWHAAHRQRRALLQLDDAMLKDLGISRADAVREGNRPFWRP